MILEVMELSYMFKNNRGINNISFSVKSGEIMAIIGPNGAGKTTLLRALIGIIRPQKGDVLIDKNVANRGEISFLLSDEVLINKFTVLQMINYFNSMKNSRLDEKEINLLLQKYNLIEYRNEKIQTLSQGTKMRLTILLTLMGDSKVIILDEPTNGLDTDSVILLKGLIEEQRKRGKIIIITSHILDFIEKIATHCIFINNGILVGECKNESKNLEERYLQIMGDRLNDRG